jgi:hypothetical protein
MTIESQRLLCAREVSEILGVCERTLCTITSPRGPLKAVRIGRSLRYTPSAVNDFIEASQR